jgi:hypothetical protein
MCLSTRGRLLLKTPSPRVVLAVAFCAGAAVFAYMSGSGPGLLTRWSRRPVQNRLVGPQFDRGSAQFDRRDGQFGGRTPPHVLSPHETTAGSVDGADMSIEYGRPRMRGREIFGALVPYGRVWCPGADEATKLTTNRPLQFGGLKLKAGEYSLWILPLPDRWSLIFNSQADAFHTYHPENADVGKIDLQKEALPEPVEQLTFAIEKNASGSGGVIAMAWENTRVSAPFIVVD